MASAITCASSAAAGTASSAKPICAAKRPVKVSPVNSSRFAHCGPQW
jgi:hypothetical protein